MSATKRTKAIADWHEATERAEEAWERARMALEKTWNEMKRAVFAEIRAEAIAREVEGSVAQAAAPEEPDHE
jgi:hypothetical protein